MDIVKIPELCGKFTFPISLKQSGPRHSPIQCFIKRNRATTTYILYYGLMPSEAENDKLLLAARRSRRAIYNLTICYFSRSNNTYADKLSCSFSSPRGASIARGISPLRDLVPSRGMSPLRVRNTVPLVLNFAVDAKEKIR